MKDTESKATAAIDQSEKSVTLKVGGTWRLTEPFPDLGAIMPTNLSAGKARVVAEGLDEWDSSLPVFLLRVRGWCRKRGTELDLEALPDALKKLFRLISSAVERRTAIKPPEPMGHPVARLAGRIASGLKGFARFVGECIIGTLEAPTHPRQIHWKTFFLEMVEAGPKALPIIGLLCFLIGVTFAYETSGNLVRFGLQDYVVQGVGASVVRQIAPLVASVVLAGRTGAAFAAHIANMNLSGEIDALEMLGVSPVNFLILPRLFALGLMLPMVTLYGDLLGILGGLSVTMVKIHMTATDFWGRLLDTLTVTDVVAGLIKTIVFAFLIGVAGTLCGLQSERTSVGVGRAVTSAVVIGIASVIVADAIFSPIFNRFGM